MKIFSLLLSLIFFNLSSNAEVFPIPEDNEVSFDVVRKKKEKPKFTFNFIEVNNNFETGALLRIDESARVPTRQNWNYLLKNFSNSGLLIYLSLFSIKLFIIVGANIKINKKILIFLFVTSKISEEINIKIGINT